MIHFHRATFAATFENFKACEIAFYDKEIWTFFLLLGVAFYTPVQFICPLNHNFGQYSYQFPTHFFIINYIFYVYKV